MLYLGLGGSLSHSQYTITLLVYSQYTITHLVYSQYTITFLVYSHTVTLVAQAWVMYYYYRHGNITVSLQEFPNAFLRDPSEFHRLMK